MLSDSPPERDIQWSDEGIAGSHKFIQKIWTISEKIQNISIAKKLPENTKLDLEKLINKCIKEITSNLENFHFNIAIAKFYEFVNALNKYLIDLDCDREEFIKILKKFIILLYPFTPHITCEIWEKITKKQDLHLQKWPSFQAELLKQEEFNIVIQLNGKKRAILKVKGEVGENDLFQMSLELDNVKKLVENKKITKKIYIKNKLINFVIHE